MSNRTPPQTGTNAPRWIDEIVDRVRARVPATPHRILRLAGRSRRVDAILADLPWRIVIGVLLGGLPLAILALIAGSWSVAMAAVVALALVAFATYLADWVGGLSALGMSFLILDLLFVDHRTGFARPTSREDRVSLLIFVLATVAIIWLVQRVKAEGTEDRQSAIAARSAASALSAIETIAATRQRLSYAERQQIYQAIVHSVVGVNRAHAGALMLSLPGTDDFLPDAVYGFGAAGSDALKPEGLEHGFVRRIGLERRPLQVYDVRGTVTRELQTTPVRALLGAPVISPDDRVLGVIVLGLLVPHRFTSAEVKKLEAYSSQIAGILETMSATGEREFELQQAREEQRRLERVIAAIPEAVVVVAPDQSVVAANAVAEELFGAEIEREFTKRLQTPDGEPIVDAELPIQRAMETGEPVEGVELAIDRGDGHALPLLASAAPYSDQYGQVTTVVGAFRDISSLQRSRSHQGRVRLGCFSELRSPLTPIRGYVQLVARELSREGNHDLQVQRLNSIDGHVLRLARLVDDLLDVSRMRAGSLEIRPIASNLVELTRDVVQVRSVSETSSRIELIAPRESVRGNWDPDRIQQVIDNLVEQCAQVQP
ncbi:MAG: PAS domain-containing protein [Thermomicrobiales bacterium]|nr:PAS domain-containing protein [Thermomicrobiales bacterium]